VNIPCVDIPEGVSGNWRVERFTVSEKDVALHNIRCMFKAGFGNRTMRAGTYTRIVRGTLCVMSDTDAEKRDHWQPVHHAKGNVLINGLGIGMVLNACLIKPEVAHCTVIERSPDVIALVAPHWRQRFGDRLTIIEADAFEYAPPKGIRFGAVWHDVWNDINPDNLDGMKRLHRRYGRRTDWQGSWCRSLCELYR